MTIDTITVNNKNYKIVNDLVVDIADDMQSSENNFISSTIVINNKNYNFINNYDSITSDNCIGLWQTILINANFDYTNDFAYRFTIDKNKHYISFSLSDNKLKTNTNDRFANDADYELVDIEDIIQEVTQVVVVKTPSKIQFEKRKKIKIIAGINIIIWLVIVVVYGIYYMLNIDKKVLLEKELKAFNQVNTALHNQIAKKQNQLVKTNNQQVIVNNINFLLAIINANIDFKTPSEQKINNKSLKIDIAINDIPMLQYLSSKHSYNINNINRNIKTQRAIIDITHITQTKELYDN
jgi:hypothetical protein